MSRGVLPDVRELRVAAERVTWTLRPVIRERHLGPVCERSRHPQRDPDGEPYQQACARTKQRSEQQRDDEPPWRADHRSQAVFGVPAGTAVPAAADPHRRAGCRGWSTARPRPRRTDRRRAPPSGRCRRLRDGSDQPLVGSHASGDRQPTDHTIGKPAPTSPRVRPAARLTGRGGVPYGAPTMRCPGCAEPSTDGRGN